MADLTIAVNDGTLKKARMRPRRRHLVNAVLWGCLEGYASRGAGGGDAQDCRSLARVGVRLGARRVETGGRLRGSRESKLSSEASR